MVCGWKQERAAVNHLHDGSSPPAMHVELDQRACRVCVCVCVCVSVINVPVECECVCVCVCVSVCVSV